MAPSVAPDGGDVPPADDEVTPTGQDDVPREIAVARMPRISVSPPEHGDAKDAQFEGNPKHKLTINN